MMKKHAAKRGIPLSELVVVDEPHRRYVPDGSARERHKHVALRCLKPFAHEALRKSLEGQGVHGRFHHHLVGWASYLAYLVAPTASKLQQDLDPSPWCWPARSLEVLRAQALVPANQSARNPTSSGESQPSNVKLKKRSRMDFSEITDCFAAHNVRTVKQAWQLAKTMKLDGDVLLWQTLGEQKSVTELLAKFNLGWHGESSGGTLHNKSDFPLSAFVVPEECMQWVRHDSSTHALILQGMPKLGKTEMACALMLEVRKSFHFLNTCDDLREITMEADEGLVLDEVDFSSLSVNDCKAWTDLAKARRTAARNKNGVLLKGTPRIFTTNSRFEEFFPRGLLLPHQIDAIHRRVKWVVCGDVRAVTEAATGSNSAVNGTSSSSSGHTSSNIRVALSDSAAKVSQDLFQAVKQFSPATKRKFIEALADCSTDPCKTDLSAALAGSATDPTPTDLLLSGQLPIAEEQDPDVFGLGGAIDNEEDS